MRTAATSVILLAALAGCSRPSPTQSSTEILTATVAVKDAPDYDSAFWSTWADGSAELAAYDLVYPRYGAPRAGTAVTIFVTETFSKSLRVKSDPGKHPPADEFPVMKLNLIKEFRTGIYDYGDMLSSFVALAPVEGRQAGSLTKASFSSQEWCGHVYKQLLFDPLAVRLTSHSYFDGEADQDTKLDYPPDGVSEDSLMLWARRMARPLLGPGESRSLPMLTSMELSRNSHKPQTWIATTLARSKKPESIEVNGTKYEADVFTVSDESGFERTFYVETAVPYRIVRWQTSEGERGDLIASDRMKYWQLNAPGGEDALRKLRIAPRPRRTM